MIDYRETEEGLRRFTNPAIYEKTLAFQTLMAEHGVAWHNHFANECTIDFCCCQGDNILGSNYKHYIPSFRTAIKQAFMEYYEEIKVFDKSGHLAAHMQKFINDNY